MKAVTGLPEGSYLFISKCNAFHQLYNQGNCNESAWDAILVPIQKKAILTDEDRHAIYNWILEIKNRHNKSAGLN